MNWKQYFDLKEKQRKKFWLFLFIIVLGHYFFYSKIFFEQGSTPFCDKLNLSYEEELLDSKSSLNNSDFNLTNNFNESANEFNSSENNRILNDTNISENERKLIDYLWLECAKEPSEITFNLKAKLWYYRFFYSPLFIFVDMFLAYFLSLIAYFHYKKKVDGAGDEKEGDKEKGKEKKEDKK